MTRRFRKLAHSLYECKYHVVFCPKYRYKIMQDDVRQYVTQQAHRLCSQEDDVEGPGGQCASRPCPSGALNPTQVCGVGAGGISEGKAGAAPVRPASPT